MRIVTARHVGRVVSGGGPGYPVLVDHQGKPVAEVLEYVRWNRKQGVSASQRAADRYLRVIADYITWARARRLDWRDALHRVDVYDSYLRNVYRSALGKPLSTTTIERRIRHLRRFARWMDAFGLRAAPRLARGAA